MTDVCGIAGCWHTGRSDDVAVVYSQVKSLLHRGPDSFGVFQSELGVIGQSRLAVIDLRTGDPPIKTPGDGVGVVLNGEIYNYQRLRDELRALGHDFTTQGDTEVIAHAIEAYEPVDVARRLDGMFAFAAVDVGRRRLVLARDRFGKKPLYWWTDGRAVVFGSEIKALLASPLVSAELDESAISAYLTFGAVPSPRTMFTGIRSVPPASVLIADEHGITVERYWDLPVGQDRLDVSLAESGRLVAEGLQEAVRKRLLADVPIGAFLSGGIDSSAVVASMAVVTDHVKTFTIGFEDQAGYDERGYARLVAERFGTEHHEHVVKPDAIEWIEEITEAFDEPFADSSALPTFLLSKVTRGEVTVALSGDGGDELFAGYERFFAARVAARTGGPLLGPFLSGAHRLLRPLDHQLAAKGARFARRASLGMPHALRSWVSYMPDEDVASLRGTSDWAFAEYEARWAATRGTTLDRILELNIGTYLLDDLLPKVDRTSMANGLEVRSPFLDAELATLAFRLPPSVRLRGNDRKRCLKQAMRGVLPDSIIDRPKRGFGVPLDRWFREDLAQMVSGTLGSPTASVRRYLAGPVIDGLLADHQDKRRNAGQELWTLLMLELFLRRWGW